MHIMLTLISSWAGNGHTTQSIKGETGTKRDLLGEFSLAPRGREGWYLSSSQHLLCFIHCRSTVILWALRKEKCCPLNYNRTTECTMKPIRGNKCEGKKCILESMRPSYRHMEASPEDNQAPRSLRKAEPGPVWPECDDMKDHTQPSSARVFCSCPSKHTNW